VITGRGEFKLTKEGTLMWVLAVITSLWLLTGATGAPIDSGMIPVPVLYGRVNDTAEVLPIEDQERLAIESHSESEWSDTSAMRRPRRSLTWK
jgi:hypothetical protein